MSTTHDRSHPSRRTRAASAVVLALAVTSCVVAPAPASIPAASALGPYSAARLHGDFVFLSGKIGSAREGTFAEEATSCLDAVEGELVRAGITLDDVVQATVYLTDIETYGVFNDVYRAKLAAPYPARACVAVVALPGNARVEVSVVAARR